MSCLTTVQKQKHTNYNPRSFHIQCGNGLASKVAVHVCQYSQRLLNSWLMFYKPYITKSH